MSKPKVETLGIEPSLSMEPWMGETLVVIGHRACLTCWVSPLQGSPSRLLIRPKAAALGLHMCPFQGQTQRNPRAS